MKMLPLFQSLNVSSIVIHLTTKKKDKKRI